MNQINKKYLQDNLIKIKLLNKVLLNVKKYTCY